jgi:hypothetical protein
MSSAPDWGNLFSFGQLIALYSTMDLIALWYLIHHTNGVRKSELTPLLFTIVAVAIVLGDQPWRVGLYALGGLLICLSCCECPTSAASWWNRLCRWGNPSTNRVDDKIKISHRWYIALTLIAIILPFGAYTWVFYASPSTAHAQSAPSQTEVTKTE